jgi:hypothetical protein
MTGGLDGKTSLDAADQLRLEQMLQELSWAAFHIWDRTQRGIFPPGTFEATGGAFLSSALGTPRGRAWWEAAKHIGFVPAFAADVDALLKKDRQQQPGLLVSKSTAAKTKRSRVLS